MGEKIPQEFIDDLLTRIDIVDVVDSRVPLKKAGKEYKACCPFHGEKTPSFTVSQQKQFYHCFGCGEHGSAIGFLMAHDHMGFVEAIEELAGMAGVEVPRQQRDINAPPARNNDTLYQRLEQAAKFYRQQLKSHEQASIAIEYLKNRGLSGETAAAFELGFAPPGWNTLENTLGQSAKKDLIESGMLIQKDDGKTYDRFRERIMFPIRDRRGRVIGFGGRVLGDGEPKYLNSPETPVFHKGQELYGLYQVRKNVRQIKQLLVVEGYMDVVSLAQHGLHYAVATLGTAMTEQHFQTLVRNCQDIVFCFDGDRAGRQAAWRALETALPLMTDGIQIRFLFLPDGEDPDTMIQKTGLAEFETLLSNATRLADFFFESLSQQADMRGIDGHARLASLAKPLLKQIPGATLQNLMLNRLAEKLSVASTDIAADILGTTSQSQKRGTLAKATRSNRLTTPSPVRIAITLLLANPNLAVAAGDIDYLDGAELAGIRLLQDLIEFLRERPHLSTGAILEHWRDTEEGRQLGKLTRQALETPADGVEAEFIGALTRIKKQALEQQAEQLLHKSRVTPLSREEKTRLSELLLAGQFGA